MRVSGKSDKGIVRENNEDSFSFKECGDGIITVLCDGMGGHAAGEIASRLTANTVIDLLAEKLDGNMTDAEIHTLIDKSAVLANDAIKVHIAKKPEFEGMGTTLVVCYAINDTLYVAHAGDSRAMLLRDGTLIHLTKDHSYVQELVDSGVVTPQEAENSPFKNVITRCINGGDTKLDFDVYELQDGDVIISCSDGLTNFCPDEKIAEIISENELDTVADKLIECANENGGDDNITVTLIEI